MLNRAMLYLIRKKGKTLTLFVLIFLISTFVTTSLALMYTMNEISTYMRTTLGAQIEIRQQRQFSLPGQDSVISLEKYLTDFILKQIISIPGIHQYNTRNSGYISGLLFITGSFSSESANMGRIHGTNDSALLPDFKDQVLALTEGKHFTAEDENVVIISQTLALANGLTIGDLVELMPAEFALNEEGRFANTLNYSGPGTQAKIIGIFAENELQANAGFQPTPGLVANQLYATHALLTILGLANHGEYETATFYVENPADLPRIVKEIEQIESLDWDAFLMESNDFGYNRISRNLLTMQNLMLALLIAICVVGAIILTLILVLRMRGRVHEVGILLSLGIRKNHITGGFLLEIAIIAILTFIFSFAASGLIVPLLEQGFLWEFPVIRDSAFQSMPLKIYFVVYLFVLLMILLTSFFSTILTIRLKPNQILSKMS
jgi:ABC-type lipoprotein release transport system permease subunit